MIKKIMLLGSTLIALYANISFAQDKFMPHGSPNAKIFFNFHKGLKDEASGFHLTRAYFGYEYNMTENFSAEALLDVGTPEIDINDSVTVNSSLNFTAFLKVASLTYKKSDFQASIGMIPLKQFKIQEKHWGYRYIEKSFQDLYGLGTSADLGASVAYKFSDLLSADLTVRNGEGYKKLQSDNDFNTGLGVTLTPAPGWTFRGFYDYVDKETPQYTIAHFVGYQNKKLSAGIEFNSQLNHKSRSERHLSGYSAYASYNLSDKFQIFGRYDDLYSSVNEESGLNWNAEEDGRLVITGIEYSPIAPINVALNYQGWVPEDEAVEGAGFIYINFQYVF